MQTLRLVRLAVSVPAIAVLAACSASQRASTETAVAKALISDEDEAKLGAQVKDELDKKGTKYVTDPEITNYVNGVAERILVSAKKDRPGINWQVFTIDDPKMVNAFATPGGYLFVYTGLLLEAGNEAELAAVWGHEAGHVVARHSARQMVNAYGLEAVAAAVLGQNPSVVGQVVAGVVGNGTMLANSRGDENEADALGTRYASRAGYDPHGIALFFGRIKERQGQTPAVMTWLSTHPDSGERVKSVNAQVTREGLGGSDLGGGRLDPIKQRLRGQPTSAAAPPPATPPPPSPPPASSSPPARPVPGLAPAATPASAPSGGSAPKPAGGVPSRPR